MFFSPDNDRCILRICLQLLHICVDNQVKSVYAYVKQNFCSPLKGLHWDVFKNRGWKYLFSRFMFQFHADLEQLLVCKISDH
jgi:hypothetical protein